MKYQSKISLTLLASCAALMLAGCGESTSSSAGSDHNVNTETTPPVITPNSFSEVDLITHLTDNVITPTFQQFLQLSIEQAQAVKSYCADENALLADVNATVDVNASKQNAQLSWQTTMNSWQQAEMMQIGPLLLNNSSLRNKIYSWPVVSACAVDQDVIFFEQGSIGGTPYDISLRTEPRKGLDALEYLLFNNNPAHSCSAATAPSGWDNRIEQNKKVARCNFAIAVADDLVVNATTLVDQWTGNNGYAQQLKQAGTSASELTSIHQAVNLISDAMFYIDSTTKDAKLAKPLGLLDNVCGAQPCAAQVESPYSHHSMANIVNNLIALQKLFAGDDTQPSTKIGFDDFLKEVGDNDAAVEIARDILLALQSSQAYQESLANTLSTNPDKVQASHADLKKVSDNMKTDFIKSLALELPKTSAGDND